MKQTVVWVGGLSSIALQTPVSISFSTLIWPVRRLPVWMQQWMPGVLLVGLGVYQIPFLRLWQSIKGEDVFLAYSHGGGDDGSRSFKWLATLHQQSESREGWMLVRSLLPLCIQSRGLPHGMVMPTFRMVLWLLKLGSWNLDYRQGNQERTNIQTHVQ